MVHQSGCETSDRDVGARVLWRGVGWGKSYLLQEIDGRYRVVPEDCVNRAHGTDGSISNSCRQLRVRAVSSPVQASGAKSERMGGADDTRDFHSIVAHTRKRNLPYNKTE